MIKVALLLFVAGELVGGAAAPSIEECEKVRARIMADPGKPPELQAQCFVLREKA